MISSSSFAPQLRHLLLLCCNDGQPFVDFHEKIQHHGTRTVDPTDWSAEDISGSSLSSNSSILSALPIAVQTLLHNGTLFLEQCDLFNLTFSSTADQAVFDHFGASLECRCPLSHSGIACEVPALPTPLPLIHITRTATLEGHNNMLIVLSIIALAIFFFTFMMLRGCLFCDCFGPFKSPAGRRSDSDKELDPEEVRRALAKVRAYEESRAAEAGLCGEVRRPLVVPSSSHACPAPYDQVVPPPPSSDASSFAPVHHPLLPSTTTHSGTTVYSPTAGGNQSRPGRHSPPPAYSSVENLPASTNI